MCFGPEIAAALPFLLGAGALSAGGAIIDNMDAQAIAEDQAKARNLVLTNTLLKNDPLADQARSTFGENQQTYTPTAVADRQAGAEAERYATAEAATKLPESLPTSADAPSVVNQEVAKRLGEAVAKGKERARASAKLGAFGDQWFQAGMGTDAAARDLGVNANLSAGNLSLLSPLQDLAEIKATRPRSPVGAVLRGLGSTMGSAVGAGWIS